MLKIKRIIMKEVFIHELLAITGNNKTIYFYDGYLSTQKELNTIYKEIKEKYSSLLTIDKQEYTQEKEEFIQEYTKKKDPYPLYIEDYRQYNEAMEKNEKINNIIERVKNL